MKRMQPKGFRLVLGGVPANTKRIALTGGPCAGKTTAIARLAQRLMDLGFQVFVVPEAATILKHSGTTPPLVPGDVFQAMVLNQSLLAEEHVLQAARYVKSGQRVVIITDRGIMDGGAYANPDLFDRILGGYGLTRQQAFGRYDGVFHLVTAADGAEEFYTCENNTARSETPEEARVLDGKTLKAWMGHPHLRIFDNSTDFKGKVDRLIKEVCLLLGVPAPLEIEKKFTVKTPDIDAIRRSVHASRIHLVEVGITQHYLIAGSSIGEGGTVSESRVRKRTFKGSSSYFHTVKIRMGEGQSIEHEERISSSRYHELLGQRDPRRVPVTKTRFCFVWNSRVYELDRFHGPDPMKGKWLLEVELASPDERPEIPPFLAVTEEVTDDPKWKNSAIALMA